MSEENVELSRRVLDAFNRRDLDAYLALLDDDVEAVPRIAGGLGSSVRGHAGIRQWWKDLFEFIPDLSIEIVGVRDRGDLTIATTRYHGHGAASNTPLAETAWLALQWRRGKCVWWSSTATEAEALEAAGALGVVRTTALDEKQRS